ncbi:hypothetical protein Taro_045470 [Colocasia esculenta]|uniref:Uncharacterized protein n=1 Tax=Colocasia esculenta TaxID=4460 RepID=A0A843WPJ7_COLES|nr:hypothetical protein [Colocasia esculenta]
MTEEGSAAGGGGGVAVFIENYGTHIIVGLAECGWTRCGVSEAGAVPEFASLLGQPDDGDFDQSMESLPSCSLSFASARDISFRSLPVSEVAFDEGIDSRSCSDHIVINNELEEIASLEWLARCMAETNMSCSRSSCESAAGSPIQNKWHAALLPALSSKAVNKPPIQDLEYFLDFQLPKAWAPIFNDLPLGRSSNRPLRNPALMGLKLYVNTAEVIPVPMRTQQLSTYI